MLASPTSFTLVTILYFSSFDQLISFNVENVLPPLTVLICLLNPKIFCISIIVLDCSTEENLSRYIIHKAKTREKTKLGTLLSKTPNY